MFVGSQTTIDEETRCTKNKTELKVANFKRTYFYVLIENYPRIQLPIWKPLVWNNFCIRVNSIGLTSDLSINSKIVKTFKFEKRPIIKKENIILMNKFDDQHSGMTSGLVI